MKMAWSSVLVSEARATHRSYTGEELLQKFRRGFDKKPIEMRPDHPFWTGRDRRYQHLGPNALPTGESLRMCQERVLPYWVDNIVPAMRRGKRVFRFL